MKVSVVIPVYNGEKHLRQTLESVFAQTYPASEIIVVNDGSTDGSLAILSEYGGAIRLLHQKNCGVSHARNRGVEESKGELIALLDQDDIWCREKVEKQVKVFTENPAVSFVYSDVDFLDASGNLLKNRASVSWKGDWMRPLLKGHFHPFPSTVMIKRDLYIAQGGFSTDFIKNTHEDVEFWVRLSTVTAFYFVEEPLVQYRFDLRKVIEREGDEYEYRWQNMLTLYEKLIHTYQKNPEMRKYMKKVLKMEARLEAARLGGVGKKLVLSGNVEGARKNFRDACRLDNRTKHWSRYIRSRFPGRFHKYLFAK
jgi:glycosyltransferase involved in cell wall biosynthesis